MSIVTDWETARANARRAKLRRMMPEEKREDRSRELELLLKRGDEIGARIEALVRRVFERSGGETEDQRAPAAP